MKQLLPLIKPFREMRKIAALCLVMLMAFMALPEKTLGQAPVNTILWAETWTGGEANETPSAYGFEGTTVYGGTTLTYTQSSNSTKLYNESLAGGAAPELLLYKSNTTWTITGIPTGNASGLTLTFKANYDRAEVSSATTGVTIGTKSFTDKTVTYPITVNSDVSTFALEFKNTSSSNVRIDNIELIVTTIGGDTPLEIVATPTFSPEGGLYTESQTVAINCSTDDATIYYTLDGTNPTSESNIYSSALPISETTTIKAIAVKDGMNNSAVATATYTITLPYTGDDYVRITDINSLADGDRVILAARYDATETSYYAMTAATTGKPTGVSFTSTTSSNGEILPSSILNSENTYYWTLNVTTNGYTFTNASGNALGYSSGTNFATGGNNTGWTITRATAGTAAMVSGYEGFYITNKNNTGRGIALNNQHNYGPYATSNNNNGEYNFYLDIFVQGYTPAAVATPVFTPEEGIYFETQNVTISCETPNSVIYYTIDGTEPTNASAQYTGAIAVAETTTIKAVAYVGTDHSYVATATYTIEQPLSTIEEIFNAATATPTTHRIHFNNWVITGANNSNHSFLSDGTNGCMIYGSEQGFTAGDILSGIVECDIQIYNGSLELTELSSTTTGLTVTAGGTVTVANIAMANLAAINTGALVSYQNLTCSVTTSGNYTNYYLTDGTTQIQAYTTLYNDLASSFENGKVYNITGVFVQNNNIKRINPRSAADIVEVEVPHEEYTLTVSDLNHVNLFIFGGEESETIISTEDGETTAQVFDGTEVLVSIDVEEGYVFQSLTVTDGNGDPVETEELTANEYYSFTMPTSNVTITATAIEYVAPTPGNYARVTSLSQLTNGSKVIIAARHNSTANSYYAMPSSTSGKPEGVQFISVVSDGNEMLPSTISDSAYFWTVGVTSAGYTFTNANGALIGYSSSTNFATGGDNTEWTVTSGTSEGTAMVPDYTGFNIVNKNSNGRAFAFNGTVFGAYSTSNMNGSGYNFILDFFVESGETPVPDPCETIVLTEDAPTKDWTFEGLTTVTEPYTGEDLGDCWTWNRTTDLPEGYVDTLPHLYYNSSYAHSGSYSLRLWNRGVYAMPVLDETVDINRVKMSFYSRHSYSFYTMMVGVMTNPNDPSTFVPVAYVDNGSSTGVEYFECDFSKYDGEGRYIAFKNVRSTNNELDGHFSDVHSVNYIDDIVLTLMPESSCTIELADLPYSENFDAVTSSTNTVTGASPRCWKVVEGSENMSLVTAPQVYYNYSYAESGYYSLRMANRGVYAMPALSEDINIKEVQLSMYVRQPNALYQLQVGVWDEDNETFTPVALVNNSTTGLENFTCDFSNYDGSGRRIAFRNTLGGGKTWNYSYNYIDDVVLSQVECEKVSAAYTESFEDCTDATTAATGAAPACWDVVDGAETMSYNGYPQVYYNSDFANDGDYSLRMSDRCVYAMPELAEGVNLNSLSMTLYVRQPYSYYQLEVGVWDGTAFAVVETVNNSDDAVTPVTVDFGGYEGTGRIAFRNTLNGGKTWNYSYNYIDNISFGASTGAKNEMVEGGVNGAMDNDRYLDNIAVYPNPTTGVLHIDAVGVQKVECYSQMGQLVGVYDNVNELNISELADGVYMLRITVPQGVTMRKVVKR